MKNTLKLVIPLILGLIAGLFNFLALKSAVQEVSFVKASREIEIGETFDEGSVEELPMMAKYAETLKDSAVLYQDLGLLSGQRTTRTIQAGDIIFYRDTESLQGELYDFREGDKAALPVSLEGVTTPPKMRVGDHVELKIPVSPTSSDGASSRWIGPFRLVSVGEEVSNSAEITESTRISVAYDDKNDTNREMFNALENFIDQSRTSDSVRLINIRLLVR
jgi:hypothetical protein